MNSKSNETTKDNTTNEALLRKVHSLGCVRPRPISCESNNQKKINEFDAKQVASKFSISASGSCYR